MPKARSIAALKLKKQEAEPVEEAKDFQKNVVQRIVTSRDRARRVEQELKEEQEEQARIRKQKKLSGEISSSSDEYDEFGNLKKKKSNEDEDHQFTTGQMIGHAALALVFISFPLSEPGIEWEGVAYLVGINLLFNILVRTSSLQHIIILSLINIVTLQWYTRVPNLYMALLSMGPVRLSATIGGNALAVVIGYFFYVRKQKVKKSKHVVAAWDKLLSTLVIVNVCVLIYVGTVGWEEVKAIIRGFASLFMKMPNIDGDDRGENGENSYQKKFEGKDGVEAEFF